MRVHLFKHLVLCLGTVLVVSLTACESSSVVAQDSALRGTKPDNLGQPVQDADGSFVQMGEGEYSPSNSGDRRRLWSWFSLLFLLGDHGPCPEHHIGPLIPPHCLENVTDADDNPSSATDGDYAEYADYSDVDSSSGSDTGGSEVTSGGNLVTSSFRSNWLLWAIAGAAATAAIVAVAYGQRKREVETHPLKGSVGRRMSLFSNFADTACDNACVGSNVEMPSGKGDYTLS